MKRIMKKEKKHYEKATNEIIEAIKDVIDYCVINPLKKNPFSYLSIRKGKKLIIKMLKSNFVAKRSKWI